MSGDERGFTEGPARSAHGSWSPEEPSADLEQAGGAEANQLVARSRARNR